MEKPKIAQASSIKVEDTFERKLKYNLIILGELRDLCETYHERICGIESAKYDTEKEVEFKDYQISDLNIAVNDLRGKL